MPDNHQDLVQKYFRWNFNCHFWEGVAAVAAFTIFGVFTIMPGLIHEIAQRAPEIIPYENRLVTGLGIAFWGISPLMGFFFTGYFESKKERKYIFIKWGLIAKISFLSVTVATFFMTSIGYKGYLVVLYLSLIGYALVSGFMMPQWLDFIGRIIPVNKRGILFGGRDAIGKSIGIGILFLFPWLSRTITFPYNYCLIYTVVVILQLVSYVIFISFKEIPYTDQEIKPRPPLLQQFKNSFRIFKDDTRYRNLMIAVFIISFCTISTMSLYAMKAIRTLQFSGPDTARFTSYFGIITDIGYIISMPLFGLLADRWGYKKILYISYITLFITYMIVIQARSEPVFYLAAFLHGIMRGGNVLAAMNFPLEFAPETRRPSYLSLRFLFSMPFMVMPFIGGWIADRWGYDVVFMAASVFVVLGMLMYRFRVIDPRKEKPIFQSPLVRLR
jgi:MFS family permease